MKYKIKYLLRLTNIEQVVLPDDILWRGQRLWRLSPWNFLQRLVTSIHLFPHTITTIPVPQPHREKQL